MALPVRALEAVPINPQVVQGQVYRLHAHYLFKHNEALLPYSYLNDGAAIIAAVALSTFSGLSGMAAVLIGIGGFGMIVGLGRFIISLTPCLQINKKAADAIIAPGFYEYAMANPRQLSSAGRIVATYQIFTQN